MGENLGYKNRTKGEAAHGSNAHGDGDVVNQIAGIEKRKKRIKKWAREAVDF
jgi:hypothetical protein